MKTSLRIVNAITAIDAPGREESLLVRISEAAFNPSSKHSLLSHFQLEDYGCFVDSRAKQHGGLQSFYPNGEGGPKIPLKLSKCLLHFKSHYPTAEELAEIEPIDITQGEIPLRPSDHCDSNDKIDIENNHNTHAHSNL